MIHDLLIICLNSGSKKCPIEDLMSLRQSINHIHPLEENLFNKVIRFIKCLREIGTFVQACGKSDSHADSMARSAEDELMHGNYIKSFADGLELLLDEFYKVIIELEQLNLENSYNSLLHVYSKMQEYEPLFFFLQKLTHTILSRKIHGCPLMQLLYQYIQNGDCRLDLAISSIHTSVIRVFLKHLANWTLYGKTDDYYEEYFIQRRAEPSQYISYTSSVKSGTSSEESSQSDEEIWQWDVCYELVPPCFGSSWAEKVLFIGKTVLIFRMDDVEVELINQSNTAGTQSHTSDIGTLWNGKEYIYYNKIYSLLDKKEFKVSDYEEVIEDMKSYVCTRFAELAITEVNFMRQLTLVKDFFLMGRGELHLEYIRQSYKVKPTETQLESKSWLRDIIRAYDMACSIIGAFEFQEKFSVSVIDCYLDSDELNTFYYPQYLKFNFKIVWPLHLIFSPKVISHYNIIYRFLLTIKKIQYELQMVWQKINQKNMGIQKVDSRVLHLCYQLTFFINTLQYYIQVDVLESQYNIFLSSIENKRDFEEINRAQTVFQMKVLSLCFLQVEDTRKSTIYQSSICIGNPVNDVLSDMFLVCHDFCDHIESVDELIEIDDDLIENLKDRFYDKIEKLLDNISKLHTPSNNVPFKQLITRLDFNHWYSLRNVFQNEPNDHYSTPTSEDDDIYYDTKQQ
ncbi:gamma-tubulin complex component 4 homolog [Teleopsis dalmanni]|uniref:gamma-tubulin complex component 4 homolog n=1 Tax=Teleopsis dalmanni TaxID=139649 RepID=UPI0018CFC253|nr:gamma-tubulin complex component 4 homolog [Teleopsis dalmanni]